MTYPVRPRWCYFFRGTVCAALLIVGVAAGHAAEVKSGDMALGRIDFSVVELPPATVEVDFSRALFTDLLGLGDAAIDGVIESLTKATADSDGSRVLGMAAEKLGEAKELVKLIQEVIHSAQVRVYEDLEEEVENVSSLAELFQKQLKGSGWETVLTVNDGDESVQVSILRVEGSIMGVFAVVVDGNDVVLANVVGEISPGNIKKLASLGTKFALENGLHKELEREFMRGH